MSVLITAKDIVESLEDKDLLKDRKEAIQFIESLPREVHHPFYIRILECIGAFIASICFWGFLFLVGILDLNHEFAGLVYGLMAIGGAIGLLHVSKQASKASAGGFITQIAFALMIVGKGLFLFGFTKIVNDTLGNGYEGLNGHWVFPVACLFITAVTYPLFSLPAERYLSCLLTISAFVHLSDLSFYSFETKRVLFYLTFFLQVVAINIFVFAKEITFNVTPLYRALLTGIAGMILIMELSPLVSRCEFSLCLSPIFFKVILTLMLIGLLKVMVKTDLVIIAAALALGYFSSSGIVFSIILLILGYGNHDRFSTWFGFLLLPIFLIEFYYSLNLTLFAKSGILLGSGVILLLVRQYVMYRGWGKEEIV